MNADQVRRMIAARGNLTAGCCSVRIRQNQGAREVTDFIASGTLGDLRVVQARDIRAAKPKPQTPRPDWRLIKARNGGGILLNWGCYDLDYLLGIIGWKLKPKSVFAQAWTVPPQFASHVAPGSDAETYYVALVRCDGGTVISLERGEYMAAESGAAWRIIGTKGSLQLDMLPQEGSMVVHDDSTTEDGVISRTIWEYDPAMPRDFSTPVEDFAQAVREHRQPGTSLEEALVVQEISDAVYASAERGTAIEIS